MNFDVMQQLYAAGSAVAAAAGEESAGGVLGTLGIDWRLFAAQLINFGVIVLILWKWVFKPVSAGLQARTDRIEKSLREAAEIEKEKKAFDAWRREELVRSKQEAAAIVSSAERDAKSAKDKILSETRIEQEHLIRQANQQMESERDRMVTEARDQLADLVVLATEKVIRKNLDPKQEKEFIRQSLDRIS